MNTKKIEAWHRTRQGYALFSLIELCFAYLFVSLALDRGNLWYYLLTLLFAIGFLRNLVHIAVVHTK